MATVLVIADIKSGELKGSTSVLLSKAKAICAETAVAAIGSALKIKPILTMNRGDPGAERVRTQRRAIERLIEMVTELGPIEQIALVHTNAAQDAEKLYQQARHFFSATGKPLMVDVTPVLGANIGPGVVGFTCVAAKGEQS